VTSGTTGSITAALSATWPAEAEERLGPFLLRRSSGGGQRVTAAIPAVEIDPDGLSQAIAAAAARMRDWGQRPIFQLGTGDALLDAALDAAGWTVKDPVTVMAAELDALEPVRCPPLTSFAHWPPLAAQAAIWAESGIGPDRIAVMARVTGPKAALMTREGEFPAGTGFVALHDGVAVCHALVTLPHLRGRGAGGRMLDRAVLWAREAGARQLALAVTTANDGARRLYARHGLTARFGYHYRVAP